MAQVTVLVNGRNYTLACEDGEEEHLAALAAFIDARVAELGRSVGQVGDARLMLMASLVIADELAVVNERLEEQDQEIAELKQKLQDAAVAQDQALAEVLETASQRIEDIAARLM